MQCLRLHFAIFCITQQILALRNDPVDCCTEYAYGAQQCRVADLMWMFTLCTGMSLLTYMTEVLVRRLANHFQSGSTTPRGTLARIRKIYTPLGVITGALVTRSVCSAVLKVWLPSVCGKSHESRNEPT